MENYKIVIADDDAGLTMALAVRLQNEGYDVIPAYDGYNALARAVEHEPDLLILDINMPAGDGFTVQERMTKIPDIRNVPVIYVSGDTSMSAYRKAEKANAFALISKPIKMKELLQTIQQSLIPTAA